jgi:hypothetical protein
MRILNSRFSKIAAIIGLAGILGTATSTANAGNYGVNLSLGNGAGIYFSGNGGHHNNRRYNNRHNNYNSYNQPRYNQRHNRHRNSYNQPRRQQVCGPRRAVNKAYRLGLNDPQIQRIKERRIVVSGYQYGYRTKMVFKRYSNCKLIKTVNFNR